MSEATAGSAGPEGGGADRRRVVVVGGGLAGVNLAIALRRHGFPGPVTILDPGDTLHDRPPLSKGYLSGEIDDEKIKLQPDAWFAEHDVTVRHRAEAVRADPQAGFVELADGSRVEADVIVLATGGTARRLPLPGADTDRLHHLRTIDDARRLKPLLTPGSRLLVIGAGLIGAEVASTASKLGSEVTIVDPVVPLATILGPELAGYLHDMHTERGLTTHTTGVTDVEDTGSELRVSLDDGSVVEADLALVGIGMIPNTAVGQASGARIQGGVVVDGQQRTSVPGLYAIGDCCRHELDGALQPPVEHWEGALHDAQRAASDIAGEPAPGAAAEWFWSDRHGHHVEAVGDLTAGTRVVRGEFGTPPFSVFTLDGTTLLGAAAVDQTQSIQVARRAIEKQLTVDPAALADPAADLRKLLRVWMKASGA